MSHAGSDLSIDFSLSTLVDYWAGKIRPNLNGPTLRRRAAELGAELVDDLKKSAVGEASCPLARAAFDELVVAATAANRGGTDGVKQHAAELLERRYRS